jgi:hypothetical protein
LNELFRSKNSAPEVNNVTQAAAPKPLRLRIDVDDFSRPLSPDQEPQLIVPALASRPLNSINADLSSQRAAADSGNPLRTDFGARAVVPTTLTNSDSTRNYANQPGGAVNSNANSAASIIPSSNASTSTYSNSNTTYSGVQTNLVR